MSIPTTDSPQPLVPKSHCFRYAYLIYCALTASIGFFFYGYYLGELNNISKLLPCNQLPPGVSPGDTAHPFLGLNLPPCIPMSTIQFSLANAILPIGGICGALMSGKVAERYGRLTAMRFLSIPFILAPLALTFANSYAWLLVGRFIAGIGTGGSATIIPIYMSEISPLHLRGTIGSISGTAIATGMAVAALMGFFLSAAVPQWRWILALPFFIALLQALLLMFCVESPKWLALHESEENSGLHILVRQKLGHHSPPNHGNSADASVIEQVNLEHVAHSSAVLHPVKVRDFLTQPEHRSSLIILALAFGSQQFCGVNVYFAYSIFILTMVLSQEATSLFYLIFTFAVIPINYASGMIVDRFGRRPLILGAMLGMAISAALLTMSVVLYIPILALLMFVTAVVIFSVAQGNIPFILVSEVVEPRAASVASSVAQMVNLVSQFILLFVFPILLSAIGPYTFLFFTGYLLIAGSVLSMYLPETKGRSSVDVVDELRAKRNLRKNVATGE